MSDLSDLYQELILDHSKHPHNQREIADANHRADGYNPLCGDKVRVFVKTVGDRVEDAAFIGTACSICTASASLMTDAVKGRSQSDALQLFERFHAMMTGDAAATVSSGLGKLAVLSGVRNYPIRVKCATLPWHTFRAAIADERDAVTTE